MKFSKKKLLIKDKEEAINILRTYGYYNVINSYKGPYINENNQWYFQGYCLCRNDYRLFRLSRMADLEMSKDTFVPRVYQKPVLDITEIVETLETEIKIRIHKSIMDRVLDFCAYEHFTPDGDEHYIVNFPFIDRDYYYDMLLSFGDKCECLEPLYVREKVKRKILRIASLYDN